MSLSEQHHQAAKPSQIADNYDPLTDKGDYMNKNMRAYFRDQLSRKAEELNNDLAGFARAFQQNSNPPDILDRGIVATEQAQARANIEKQRKLRNKINGILKEMEDNGADSEYGYCEVSGQKIGVGRLMAKPWATKTIDEQEKADRRERLWARPAP